MVSSKISSRDKTAHTVRNQDPPRDRERTFKRITLSSTSSFNTGATTEEQVALFDAALPIEPYGSLLCRVSTAEQARRLRSKIM